MLTIRRYSEFTVQAVISIGGTVIDTADYTYIGKLREDASNDCSPVIPGGVITGTVSVVAGTDGAVNFVLDGTQTGTLIATKGTSRSRFPWIDIRLTPVVPGEDVYIQSKQVEILETQSNDES